MKSVDFMIGDLVTAVYEVEENGEYKNKSVPARITGIDENCTLVGGNCDVSFAPLKKHDFGEYCVDIEPVKLTKKILGKNDWISPDGNLYSLGVKELWTFFEYAFEAEMLLINDGRIPTPIRYVHELQHALRLCGLNDLADNFKI